VKPQFLIIATLIVFANTPASSAVTGACHVSPIVADLDRSLRFYRDLLRLEVSPAPGLLLYLSPFGDDLHIGMVGLYQARLGEASISITPLQPTSGDGRPYGTL
jgi:catechol 2,3-dioxygenase-like lactoylglutathione lyase family enzyme